MFLVLTIQGCDLLNLPPFSDRHELAGWESGRRRSVTFIFSRLPDSSAKVIKDRRAARSGVVCIGVCSACVLLGRESRRTLEDRYLWHFFQSPPPCVTPPPNREACSWHSVTWGGGVHSQLCVSGPISHPMGGSSQGKTGVEREAELFTFSLCSSTQAHCVRGVWRDEEPDHWEE